MDGLRAIWKDRINAMPKKHRQYLFLAAALAACFFLLWGVMATSGDPPPKAAPPSAKNSSGTVTNVAVAGQVEPLDAWLGTAGRKLAQYEDDKRKQEKVNVDNKAATEMLTKRLQELEQHQSQPPLQMPPLTPPSALPGPSNPLAPPGRLPGIPQGEPPAISTEPAPEAPLTRVSLDSAAPSKQVEAPDKTKAFKGKHGSFLPVSFTRGVLLGGIDAPTGGQAQSNPQPTLIRLTDNAFLPNRYRAQIKDCFIIGAGYGSVSSERAYIRTVNLSCVRRDGATLEVNLQGNVYGEDGKLGLRGRLVTKQGQILANALRAGIVGGIGQGFSQSGTTYSSGPLGTITTQSDSTAERMRAGVAGGFGRAMDELAAYYIRLAEQTFPIIEVDAGRAVDVVITKGVFLPISDGAPSDDDEALAAENEVQP